MSVAFLAYFKGDLNQPSEQCQCLLFQPYSRCDCPWLIKWLLGYEDLDDDKDKENTDSKIKKYLQGVKG